MDIRYLSDLHLEFDKEGSFEDFDLPVMVNESEMVLVLAGDITAEMDRDRLAGNYWSNHTSTIKAWAKRHKAVVMVAGNHEFYFGGLDRVRKWWKNVDKLVPNFYFLDNKTVIIDGVRFIGTTMWTDLRDGDPLVAMTISDPTTGMNDFKYIEDFKVGHWLDENALAVDYLKTRIEQPFEGKTVVVTHHAPSHQSVPECFKGNKLNDAYVCDLFNWLWEQDVSVWFHGHIHSSSDYIVGDKFPTRVICNPRGYNSAPVPSFNPTFDPTLVTTI